MEPSTGLIRTRRVFWGDGGRDVTMLARCPDDGQAKSLRHCADCSRLRGAARNGDVFVLRCDVPGKAAQAKGGDSMRDAAHNSTVWDVMSNEVTCVSTSASVEMVATLLSQGDLRSVPVVDEDEKLCGIVSRSDLVRVGFEDAGLLELEEKKLPSGYHAAVVASRLAGDIMTPVVHALPEDAPASFAIALMARANLHEVPVVQCDGVVVGMITALDVMKWAAASLGYEETVLPR